MSDEERRDDQHRDPDVDAGIGRYDRRVSAEHDELAMGEVDDLHHAENDRQSQAQQEQRRYSVQDVERDDEIDRHSLNSFGPSIWRAPPVGGARYASEIDDVLLGIGRILDEIAGHSPYRPA